MTSSHSHDAFAELFVLNQRRIYGYIATLLANSSDVEEVFQQTSLSLWRKWTTFDPAGDFTRWACGIAHNHVRNFVRLHRHHNVYLSQGMLDDLAEVHLSQEPQFDQRGQALNDCLEQLPAKQRELVERCYRGTEPMKSIADKLRIAPSALYMKLHRLRQVLLHCVELALGGEKT
jgi:RNA polymerase sigma-70 factor (ECF subfamily)